VPPQDFPLPLISAGFNNTLDAIRKTWKTFRFITLSGLHGHTTNIALYGLP